MRRNRAEPILPSMSTTLRRAKLTEIEISQLRREILDRGVRPVARALAVADATALSAAVGLPLRVTQIEQIRSRLEPNAARGPLA